MPDIGTQKAEAYAMDWFERHHEAPGLFAHNGRYFYCHADTIGDSVHLVTTCCSNFTVTVERVELDQTVTEEPVHRWCLTVRPAQGCGRPVTFWANAPELATADAMTKTFLGRAKVVWEGARLETMALLAQIVDADVPIIFSGTTGPLSMRTGLP